MAFRFDLGNRDLTEEEVGVVNRAKQSFLESFARHGMNIRVELLQMLQTPTVFKQKGKRNDTIENHCETSNYHRRKRTY